MNQNVLKIVSEKTGVAEKYITVVLEMTEEGATIPFMARYRKEKTNNLDEEQLRTLLQVYTYEDKLDTRKQEVIANIDAKGKLTPELKKAIEDAVTLSEVEDLYLPYKEKKKTRASIAIAKGLEPLADFLLKFSDVNPCEAAQKFLTDEVSTIEDALQGAKDIIAERISDDINHRNTVRNFIEYFGMISTSIKKDAVDEKKVYEIYYDHKESVKNIPNHRVLAIDRGENQKILKVAILNSDEDCIKSICKKVIPLNLTNENAKASALLVSEAIQDSYTRLLFPSLERETRNNLTERAQASAIDVFALNLEQLLLTPPLKGKMMLGVDPAFRTGCKLAVLNQNGDFIAKDVIYPHEKFVGEKVNPLRKKEASQKVATICKNYNIELIAIGNGTASRETEEFIANTIKDYNLPCQFIIVSEAGASVYSASELAKKEYPDLVVEERSAISIARRVIDPLAEFIKIDPKSIGVGQYQHDVNQAKLGDSLDFVISKVVNSVGVNINTATAPLLSYVSGLTKKAAENIVKYREENGKITSREEVKKIKGIGPKSYEQAIGFLKILDSNNPLDKTFIHPENYDKVMNLLADLKLNINELGSEEFSSRLENLNANLAAKYDLGTFSFEDIIVELSKPLRDIRDEFPTPILKSDILHIEDLRLGMKLQGTVRNISDFGVFVDIGLKNDGMIHRSKLSKTRISHPSEVVSINDIIDVYVIDINIEKKRVGLSLFNINE